MHIKPDKITLLSHFDVLIYSIWFKLWFESIDIAASSLIFLETEKLDNKFKRYLKFLLFIIIGILTTPIGVIFYFIWFILFRKIFRSRPYKFSVNEHLGNELSELRVEKKFEILSMNVCFLPEVAAKVNNLNKTKKRASLIGNTLIDDSNRLKRPKEINTEEMSVKIVHSLAENNADFDFVCLQEVWSIDIGRKLCKKMHNKYKYVVYDAEINTFKSNKFIGLGSGLFLASKYPIVAVDFKQFSNKVEKFSLEQKGFLMCKVNEIRFI